MLKAPRYNDSCGTASERRQDRERDGQAKSKGAGKSVGM